MHIQSHRRPFKCPRREEVPYIPVDVPLDIWELKKHSLTSEDYFCSYCGSLEPNRFMYMVTHGGRVIPTDKSYKAYIIFNGVQYKFYFKHLSLDQAAKLLDLYDKGELDISGGRFYSYPLFKLMVESAPAFSFGAIVSVERKVDDGAIISLIDPVFRLISKEILNNPNFIYQLDPRKWEEMIAGIYSKQGFDEVILTPRSGDSGRDVIAIKNGLGSIKLIEQVKAYHSEHVVSADEVRSLLGVLQAEQNASKAVFTTTSQFAPRLKQDKYIKPYLPSRLELIDKEALLQRLSSI